MQMERSLGALLFSFSDGTVRLKSRSEVSRALNSLHQKESFSEARCFILSLQTLFLTVFLSDSHIRTLDSMGL